MSTTNSRLQSLVSLAEHGSVHGAAAALSVTESSVSAAVAALSRDVGVPLIRRDGRGVALTDAGVTYLAYARRILGLHTKAVDAARSEADPEGGVVRIGAVTTAGEHVLPDLLVHFRNVYPRVDIRLDVRAREAIWPMLAHHEVDVVIAGRPPSGAPGQVRAVLPNTLVVVGAPPASAGSFDPQTATWLLREPGSGTRATCRALLSTLDAAPPEMTLGSHGAVVAGAVAGLGVTLVSRQAVSASIERGELEVVNVPGTPLERPWHMVSGDGTTATAELLITHVVERPEWSPR